MTRRGSSRPARRAVLRWSLRLLRREWRKHLLVVTLLTVAVAGALFGATAAYNVAPSHDGRFGLANHRFDVSFEDRAELDQFVADARSWFGDVDVITRRDVPVPGSTEVLEIRSQDPAGSLGAPMLAVQDGRLPTTPGEVALTAGAARLLDVSIGDVVELDGRRSSVVGFVENPEALDEEFALAAPSADEIPHVATILLDASEEQAESFRPSVAPTNWNIEGRGQSEKTLAAIGVLITATVAMLLVTLVAAAAFVVIAQRRQRQLGLLAAAGATERDVRLVMIADGAGVGIVAAMSGALVAFAAWIVSVPALEKAVARRLDLLDIPWWVVIAGSVLAVTAAVAAAWWPARTIAKLPIMSALSGRPSRPRRSRRSAVAACVLLVGGVVCLTFALDPSKDTGSVPLAISGVIATTFGLVLIAPPAVRLMSRLGRRAPLATRIALRDLGRFQSRSGAALAAVSLALAIAVSVIVVAAANEHAAAEGNLSDRQVLVHIGNPGSETPVFVPEVAAAEFDQLNAAVEGWASTLVEPTFVPLEVAIDPTLTERSGGRVQHPTVILGVPVDADTYRDSGLVYVATPALLGYRSIDAASIDADTVVLTSQPGDIYLVGNLATNVFRDRPVSDVQRIETSPYSSVPRALITEHGVDSAGWTPAPAGWLIESSSPITDAQLSAARDMAAASGLSIESRDTQAGLATLRSAATAAGIAVALAILAMTIGLIRAETAGDVRTFTAVGASSRTRRRVTAATAGALAISAVVVGTAAAYAAVFAGYTPETEQLRNIPVTHLVIVAVGFPLVAAAGAWLLAGRQPRHIARQLTE
jgi:putative ABC transport system permease protein